MRKIAVISDSVVLGQRADGRWAYLSFEELGQLLTEGTPTLATVLPVQAFAVVASEQTLELTIAEKAPPGHVVRTERVGENRYQAFAVEERLFNLLKRAGPRVTVLPYAAAVREAIQEGASEDDNPLRKLTRVFTGPEGARPEFAQVAEATDTVVLDTVEDDLLLTVVRGPEIAAIRRFSSENPFVELQRTIAANRLNNPRVLCGDPDLAAELGERGLRAEVVAVAGPLVGWPVLERITHLRFMDAQEVSKERAAKQRRVATLSAGIGALALLVAGLLWAAAVLHHRNLSTDLAGQRALRDALQDKVAALYAERYAGLARQGSVTLSGEMFELLLSLPPQVEVLSLEKDGGGIRGMIERRAGAAPFDRDNLRVALSDSMSFSRAQIREEYQGTSIRYLIDGPIPPAQEGRR